MTFDPPRFSDKLAREMPDAVIYADGDGIIQFWNHGAERIFGYAEREALGQSLDIIVPENLRQRHWMGYQKTMRQARRGTARATCSLKVRLPQDSRRSAADPADSGVVPTADFSSQ
jgi:PAS domain S-box-containing protein